MQAVSAGVALPLMLAVRALVGLGEGACARRNQVLQRVMADEATFVRPCRRGATVRDQHAGAVRAATAPRQSGGRRVRRLSWVRRWKKCSCLPLPSLIATRAAVRDSGTILGLLLSPPILQHFAWPGLFYVFGCVALQGPTCSS